MLQFFLIQQSLIVRCFYSGLNLAIRFVFPFKRNRRTKPDYTRQHIVRVPDPTCQTHYETIILCFFTIDHSPGKFTKDTRLKTLVPPASWSVLGERAAHRQRPARGYGIWKCGDRNYSVKRTYRLEWWAEPQ